MEGEPYSAEFNEARDVMLNICPDVAERISFLGRLIASADAADAIAPAAWAVTLFLNGFRLNVGSVEALVFADSELRMNLRGAVGQAPFLGSNFFAAEYRSLPQPLCAFVGTLKDYKALAHDIEAAHLQFIQLAATNSAGAPRKGTPFRRSHCEGLVRYARSVQLSDTELLTEGDSSNEQRGRAAATEVNDRGVTSSSIKNHFVAYHSVKQMGRRLQRDGRLRFLSGKFGLLRKAVRNTVWIIEGVPDGKRIEYLLSGEYIAESVQELDAEPGDFLIKGSIGIDFDPPVPLNDLDWFPAFFRKQSNFSFGFNRIADPLVVEALIAIRADRQSSADDTELPDIDLSLSIIEGAPRLVAHFRRERSRRLVEAKKAAVMAERGTLACEACGFDFSRSYGSWAGNFCEIHHRLALAESANERTTTLGDLAVLCSNCHRVIHRVEPMPTVEQLASHIRNECA